LTRKWSVTSASPPQRPEYDRGAAARPLLVHTRFAVYRPQAQDTSEAVDRMLMDAYRRMSPAEKMERVRALSRAAHQAAAAGIRLRQPDASEADIRIILAVRRLGEDIVRRALAKRRSRDERESG
jgi:hypothetical protein